MIINQAKTGAESTVECLQIEDVNTAVNCFELQQACRESLQKLEIGGLKGEEEFVWLAELPRLTHLTIYDNVDPRMQCIWL